MAKTKTPFFSMGAKGTVGDALTAQKHRSLTMVRTKPIPKDPYSLRQAYQRWDYRDYAHLWTLLTNSEKQIYRTAASRYHITGFSQWMRVNLKALTDLQGRWHLDQIAGATAYDSSPNTNNGVVIGASLAPGLISNRYYFDGLNDIVGFPIDPSLNPRDAITLECFVKIKTDQLSEIICQDDNVNRNYYLLYNPAGTKFQGGVIIGGVFKDVLNGPPVSLLTDYHIALTYDGTNVKLFLDGALYGTATPAVGLIDNDPVTLTLGARPVANDRYLDGWIDEARLYSTALPGSLLSLHSQRRYPA